MLNAVLSTSAIVKSENVIIEQPRWRVQVNPPETINSNQKWSSFSGLSALQNFDEFIIYKRNYLDLEIEGVTRFYVATMDNEIIYIGKPKNNPNDSKSVIELEDKNGAMIYQLIKDDKDLTIKPAIGQNGTVANNLLNKYFKVFNYKEKLPTLSREGEIVIVKNASDVKIASIVQSREPLSDKPSLGFLVDGYFKVIFDMPVDVQAKNFVMCNVFLLDKCFFDGFDNPHVVKSDQSISPPPNNDPCCCVICESSWAEDCDCGGLDCGGCD